MSIRAVLTIVFTLGLVPAGAALSADLANRPVLVIDFIGLNDTKAAQHAEQFTLSVLPEVKVQTVGFHGIVPNAWRKDAGYSAIVRYKTPAERGLSSDKIYNNLVKENRTALAFDFNESIVPQQLRFLLPNKIEGPALVAAKVVERWVKEHPDGVVVLRGHSDGTYAVARIFDELQVKGIAPQFVILESRRQDLKEWIGRASSAVHTKFIDIAAAGDLPVETVVDFPKVSAAPKNWVRYVVSDFNLPLKAHGIVTKWRERLNVTRTDGNSRVNLLNTTLGDNMAHELSTHFTSAAPINRQRVRSRTFATTTPAEQRAAAEAELSHLRNGVVFWRKTANDFQKMLGSFVKAYKSDPTQRSGDHNAMRVLATVVKLRNAMDEDIQRAASGQLVLLSPKTVEGFATVAVEVMKWVHKTSSLGAGPDRAGRLMNRFGGYSKYAAAFGRIAGGQYDPETVKLIADGSAHLGKQRILDDFRRALRAQHGVDKLRHEIRNLRAYQKSYGEKKLLSAFPRTYDRANIRFTRATREIARREALLATRLAKVEKGLARVSARLLFLDVIGELSVAIAYHAKHGHLTIEDADRYSDAAITFIATLMVMPMMASPSAAYAPVVRDGIVAAARVARRTTQDAAVFSIVYGKFFGNRAKSIELYTQYQANQLRRGERIEPIDVFYTKKERQLHGITKREVAHQNDLTNLLNSPHQNGKSAGLPDTYLTPAAVQQAKIKAINPEISPVKVPRLKKPGDTPRLVDPPPPGRRPPDVDYPGPGPDGRGGKAGGGPGGGPAPPGASPGLKESGVTVNPSIQYVPMQAKRLLNELRGRP